MPQPGDGGVGYSWFAIEVVSYAVDPDTPPPPPSPDTQQGDGGHPFTFLPIGVDGQPFEKVVSGEVRGVRPVEFSRDGVLAPGKQRVEFTKSGTLTGARSVVFEVPGAREPAVYLAKLRAEDEELLLLM